MAIGVLISDQDNESSSDDESYGQTITLDNAQVGECADIEVDGDSVRITRNDCSDNHDGEIIYVGEFSELEDSDIAPTNPDDFTDAGVANLLCRDMLGSDETSKIDQALGDEAEFGIANEDNNPSSDEKFLCYVKRGDDDKIDKQILD